MYPTTRQGRREKKRDLALLWELLHTEDGEFSEHLVWFGQKAITSTVAFRLEKMFRTYLDIFMGDLYHNKRSSRLGKVYFLLFRYGCAEDMLHLIKGAYALFCQVQFDDPIRRDRVLLRLSDELSELIASQAEAAEANEVAREVAWEAVREAMRIFASLYDIVEAFALCDTDTFCYLRFLRSQEPRSEERPDPMREMMDRLLDSKRYRWRSFWKKVEAFFGSKRRYRKNKPKTVARAPYEAFD